MPLVVALVILAGYMIFALCGNLIYWYETINSPDPAIASPRPGPLVCLFCYLNTLGGYMLCALTTALTPFCHCRARKTAGQTPDLPPLVLIHGLYNGPAVWLYLAYRFRKAGFPVTTCSYRSFFISQERLIHTVEDHVRAVEAAFPGVKPVFICHSLGGLLIRHWLLSPGNKDRAGGVITLGTPHRGSKVAALGTGSLSRRIMPTTAFIRTLQDAPDISPLPCVSLVSPTDEAVLPSANLLPPTGWRLRVTAMVGHFSMLFCPRAARILMEELDGIVRSSGK